MPKSKKEVEPLTPQEEAGLPNDVDPTVSYTDPELGGDDATGPGDTPGSHTDSELDEMTAAREAELSAGLVQEGEPPQTGLEADEETVESGTDLELGELAGLTPQTDPECPSIQSPEGAMGPFSQTGSENAVIRLLKARQVLSPRLTPYRAAKRKRARRLVPIQIPVPAATLAKSPPPASPKRRLPPSAV